MAVGRRARRIATLNAKIGVESLPSRALPASVSLSGGVASVLGTNDQNDRVVVRRSSAMIVIDVTSRPASSMRGHSTSIRKTYRSSQISSLYMSGYGGNDQFLL